MEQELKFREARRLNEQKQKMVLDRFNDKYKKKYDELELKVENLAKQGNTYGKFIKQR